MIPLPLSPQALLQKAGLSAKKSWGQNFLCDERVLTAIAEATGCDAEHPVLELGAGLGALTYHLLARGAQVTAVERDRDVVPVLRDYLAWAGEKLQILEADAGRLDYAALAQRQDTPLTVVGNLPYQLSSRILVSLADAGPCIGKAVFLVQKEVAERLEAPPGGRIFGLLSVLVQRRFNVEIVRDVPPGAFFPAPKVYSTVVRLKSSGHSFTPAEDRALTRCARAAFSSRRKTLRNSLAGGLQISPSDAEGALQAAGIDPGARAEVLSLQNFCVLGKALVERGLMHDK